MAFVRRIWVVLPIIGIALHVAFLLLFRQVWEIDYSQQREQWRHELDP